MNTFFNLEFLVPELFFSIILLFLLCWGSFFIKQSIPSIKSPVNWLLIWVFICFVIVNLTFSNLLVSGNKFISIFLFNGILLNTPFICFIKTCIGVFSCGCLFPIFKFFNLGTISRFEFPLIIGFASLGIMLLITANDLISTYLALETQALATYVMAGYSVRSAFSTEAGLKYFVMGSLSSGLFLLGSAMLYVSLGSTLFCDIQSLLIVLGDSNIVVNFGFLLIIVAFLFKLGIAPFHMWLPDVYQGSPTPSVIFFAVISKLAVFSLVARLSLNIFSPLFSVVEPVFLFFGILSLLVGAFGALFQKTLKRFLAYSSISHSGYLFLTLASNNVVSIQSFLVYSVIYIIIALPVWILVANLLNTNSSFFYKIPNIKYISDLSGLAKVQPFLAILITVFLFSMAGIPPLAGFFAKFSVFTSLLNSGLIIVSIFIAFCSMLGAFYYLRWVKIIYADPVKDERACLFDFRFSYCESLILCFCALSLVLFFLDPQPILAYFYFISIGFLSHGYYKYLFLVLSLAF